MTTVKSENWLAIIHAATHEVHRELANRSLQPPLRILITGGDDEVFAEFELNVDAAGRVKIMLLSPSDGPSTTTFPVIYTVTDSKCEEREVVFSEDVVRTLRQVS